MNILHIDSSPRTKRSHSKNLTKLFIEKYKEIHPGIQITHKDLGTHPVPLVTEAWVGGAFTPPSEHTEEMKKEIEVSNLLVQEFLNADKYIFSVPMYNLNIPAAFKAYIDQIIRVGLTFGMNENGYKPLVFGKKMLIITACGGIYEKGTPFYDYDFQEPYLRAIFGFIGITDIEFIHVQGINLGEESREKGIEKAKEDMEKILKVF